MIIKVSYSELINKVNNKIGFLALYKLFLKFQKISLGKKIYFKGFPIIKNKGILSIGDRTTLESFPDGEFCRTRIITNTSKSIITIGKNSILRGTTVWAQTKIIIGDNFLTAPYVWIVDSDAHEIGANERFSAFPKSRPIAIGNNVWVGYRAMVLKGVTIGDNVVIGAGAIVTKDIPSNSVAAGVPAKVIKSI